MGKAVHQIRVLLYEGGLECRNVLLLALANNRRRLDVTVVSNGEQFIDAVSCTRFDCVVMDENLGADTAPEELGCAASLLDGCPVLIVSNGRSHQSVVESFRSGQVEFVLKMEAVLGDGLWKRISACVAKDRKRRAAMRRRGLCEPDVGDASETDPMTGAYNRKYFERWIKQRRWRRGGHPYQCCLVVDVDGFGKINDTFGGAVGDRVIKAVGSIVRNQVGAWGTVVRWGVDEFLCVLPSSNRANCQLYAERLRKRIAHANINADDVPIEVAASIALVYVRSDALSSKTIDRAGQAMDLAKRLGGDVVCSWEMARVDRILSELSRGLVGGMERRRRCFLGKVQAVLGPTQWEHVTQHGARVSDTACRIAHAMGLGLDAIERVRLGALFHDIGKCLVPEGLLAKPCSLAIEECEVISRHSELGAWIADRLGADAQTVQMIRHHHTRYDSIGAVAHTDERLPLGARILCVADALVTMTTDRSYRSRMSFIEALQELQRERGRQFDPGVVDVAWFARDQSLLEAA